MLTTVLYEIAMDESLPATVRLLAMKLILTEAGPYQRSGHALLDLLRRIEGRE